MQNAAIRGYPRQAQTGMATPFVPMYNLRGVVLVSERVGNFQFHPVWFTLLDQLWVR
jgi:hypothetical protein